MPGPGEPIRETAAHKAGRLSARGEEGLNVQLQESNRQLNEIASAQEKELSGLRSRLGVAESLLERNRLPIPMRIPCPSCKTLHVDEGEFADKPHHTHACQSCGNVWRPAIVDTVGVRFLPGFKNREEAEDFE